MPEILSKSKSIIDFTFAHNSNDFIIRMLTKEDESIWFIAKDIAELLGFNSKGSISNALKELDSDERGSFKMNTSGGSQDMVIVSESGLYILIMRSRKPIAKPFQRWVTREVLPSIRKTGSYTLSKPVEKPKNLISVSDQELDRELKALDFILGRMNFSEKDKIDFVNETLERINFPQIKNPHLRKLEPVFTVTELLKEFSIEIRPVEFNKKLESFGVIQRGESGWTLADMQFGENRQYGNSVSPRYYRREFQKLLEIVL